MHLLCTPFLALQAHQGRGPVEDLSLLEVPDDYAPLFWCGPVPVPVLHWLFCRCVEPLPCRA